MFTTAVMSGGRPSCETQPPMLAALAKLKRGDAEYALEP